MAAKEGAELINSHYCLLASASQYRAPAQLLPLAQGEVLCVRLEVPKCFHEVQSGQTLDEIARTYQTDWLTLFHANPNLMVRAWSGK